MGKLAHDNEAPGSSDTVNDDFGASILGTISFIV